MAPVTFERVFKVYANGYTAIKDLSLEIKDGEFMVFVGPSGCGKSTALRMLAGLEDISAGKLIIGGEVVNDKTPQQRNIAMVFQNYALYPHMTARQNLEFPLRMMKLPPDERQKRVEEAAVRLGLTELLDRKPKQMSGGQRQRVAMGRAIVRDPAVFLMDEPLSNLDAKMRGQIRTEIAQLQRRMGTTTVYVTHDQVEAMTMGDRVAVIRSGELQQVAPPQELYDSPANIFVAGFIGSPAMNIFPTKISKTHSGVLSLDFGGQHIAINPAITEKYPELSRYYLDKPIIAGWRPEAFSLAPPDEPIDRCIEVDVEAVEALGHEMIVYFKAALTRIEVEAISNREEKATGNSKLLVARLQSSQNLKNVPRITLTVDSSKLYFFNQAGQAISSV
ncbi:ABC transporter ATP-binding protein [[Phormidium] sp. ETS-05]|uniref:ABC transporter ATP-binding protein n=1 Tax=[Phormidium] sp. ETS-05 TaxID=222819 RepID=UPI0018EF133D|nr:ATP-binding cassette domain-containing protein [[Phormidium] sp. ETS-05]